MTSFPPKNEENPSVDRRSAVQRAEPVNTFINGSTGNDVLLFTNSDETSGSYYLNGVKTDYSNSYAIYFFGKEGNDFVYGSNGLDYLSGGIGVDSLYGGNGTDLFEIDDGDDDVGEVYDGGAGDDHIYILNRKGNGTDLRDDDLRSIGGLTFGVAADQSDYYQSTVKMNADQFGDGLSLTGEIRINTGDRLEISMHGDPGLDLSGISIDNVVANGKTGDIFIFGDVAGEKIVGSMINDHIDGAGGNDSIGGGPKADTLSGGAGIDTLDYSASVASVTVNLTTGKGTGGDAQGDVVSGFERLVGSALSDRLTGTSGTDTLTGGDGNDRLDGGDGKDVLVGGDGKDVLTGGLGRDFLTGGLGADQFVFAGRKETTSGSDRDVITDFSHAQSDRIDLSAIDANNKTSANDAFSFIGAAAFGHHAGELHFVYSGSSTTIVEADIDGNGTADLQIQLTGHLTLIAGDFTL